MVSNILKKIFGSRNERVIKSLRKIVEQINQLENEFSQLTDEQLKAHTALYKERLVKGEALDALLPEAFATVREASKRVLGLRHFDVQLIGGMVLHQGKIAEMRTGEGKTLVATLPAYLNALEGKGVHVVTVNDYLAKRDAEWMRPVYAFLGLSTGINIPGMDHQQKQEAYQCDILYGTNNEFGFDYLRDNMAFSIADKVQRELNFAIVDEVDSILIDEARTPLIISGPAEDSSELYKKVNSIIPRLTPQALDEKGEGTGDGDFWIDEKGHQVHLSEAGQEKIEQVFEEIGLLAEGDTLYSVSSIALLHHINAALRAHHIYKKDVHYIVRDGQVIIVDEHTGRTMVGRRWSDGLHQAVEAKEKVQIRNENQTLASITFQNYFRLYNTLSGMTGTADTEAFEFQHIYALEVIVIPTNRPMQRQDMADLVYLTAEEKYQAIIEDIKQMVVKGRPVLVGTIAIETSEYLSSFLTKAGIDHKVLNAKFHEQEADIVAQAGRAGAVTIATNMAGRGTDIVLGGNWKVEAAKLEDPSEAQLKQLEVEWHEAHEQVLKNGGLHIIGTERHESRRIDNQLRGRAGRQGDAGSSRFYLSLEDSLMRIFASDRVAGLMKRLGMEKGEAIEHPWVTKAIENAQRKVEGRNFDIRKQLLEFDDVANDQRKVVYEQRNDLMASNDVSELITTIREDVLQSEIANYIPPESVEELWNVAGLEQEFAETFGETLQIQAWLDEDSSLHEQSLVRKIIEHFDNRYAEKEQQIGSDVMRHFEKEVMLKVLDELWKEHLSAMDQLRQGIHLRGYAQKNPKQEYKREAFELFSHMLDRYKHDTVSILSRVSVQTEDEVAEMERQRREASMQQQMNFEHEQSESQGEDTSDTATAKPYVRGGRKVGRNDDCPCGSGKKYKHCHGKLQ